MFWRGSRTKRERGSASAARRAMLTRGDGSRRARTIGGASLAAILVLVPLATASPAAASAASLDQCVNGGVNNRKEIIPEPCRHEGKTFENWVNGNANESKAHWAED